MPNTNSSPGSEKPAQRSIETTVDELSVAAQDKAHQARDQVQAASSAVRAKAGEVKRDVAASLSPEHASETARSVIASGKSAVAHASEEGRELLRQGSEAAVETYEATRDYALDAAHHATDVMRDAGQQTASYVRRASLATGGFMTAHALPLTFVGVGIGWLAWSIQREGRSLRVGTDTMRSSPLPAQTRKGTPRTRANLLTTGPTTSGARLMGVRTTDANYED